MAANRVLWRIEHRTMGEGPHYQGALGGGVTPHRPHPTPSYLEQRVVRAKPWLYDFALDPSTAGVDWRTPDWRFACPSILAAWQYIGADRARLRRAGFVLRPYRARLWILSSCQAVFYRPDASPCTGVIEL